MHFFFVSLLIHYCKVGKWGSEIKINRYGQGQKEQ